MEKANQTASVNYAPVKAGGKVEIHFTKLISPNGIQITGSIRKEGAEAGTVSFEDTGNYLITSIKPYGALEEAEVKAVYEAVPGCITEMLND